MITKGNDGLTAGQVVDLRDYIAYQGQAIVSKTLISNPGGTLTLFAFDAGQGLSEHTAPFDALVQILDGEAQVVIDGVPVQVQTGQMVLMPANHPHALRAEVPFKMLLTMLRA